MQISKSLDKFIPTLLIVLPLLGIVSVSAANGGLYAQFANAGYGGQAREYKQSFGGSITGPQEVPPTISAAVGTSTFNVTMDEREIDYSVNLQNETNITDVALYCAHPSSNGPKVASLFHSASGVSVPSFTGTLAQADILAAAQACSPNIDNMPHLVQAMREGNIYVNVLTTGAPNGDIRGNLGNVATTPFNPGSGSGGTPPPTTPTIIPSVATVFTGQHVDFTGHNFPHELDINISRDGVIKAHSHADGGGNFTTGSLEMPAAPGTYTYTFTAVSDGSTATATITVQNFQ